MAAEVEIVARRAAPAAGQRAGVVGAARAVGAEMRRGDGARSVSSPPRPRSVSSTASSAAVPLSLGAMDHVGEARMERQLRQRPALGGDAAVGVERVELLEQRDGLGPGGLGRRIEEAQRGRIGDAPVGEIEREAGEVGG